jgi:hypothetical protein
MRFLRAAALVGVALASALFVASFPIENSFASRAKLIQRVQPNEAAALFGEVGDKIGSPQKMIIDDAKAFLPTEGEDGVAYVDENYLKANGIYPLQLKTVTFFASRVRWGCGIAFVVLALLGGWANARLQRRKVSG